MNDPDSDARLSRHRGAFRALGGRSRVHFCRCSVNIFSRGQRAVVAGDLMHHVIQCREPDGSAGVDWDGKQAAASRREFLASVADADTLKPPIHFPTPTVGLLKADGDRFDYRFKCD